MTGWRQFNFAWHNAVNATRSDRKISLQRDTDIYLSPLTGPQSVSPLSPGILTCSQCPGPGGWGWRGGATQDWRWWRQGERSGPEWSWLTARSEIIDKMSPPTGQTCPRLILIAQAPQARQSQGIYCKLLKHDMIITFYSGFCKHSPPLYITNIMIMTEWN